MAEDLLETLMERTLLPGFSRMGHVVRRRRYQWSSLGELDLHGRVVVLSGATSGIGQAAAELFARNGAKLVLLTRDGNRTVHLIKRLRRESGNDDIHHVLADLTDRQQVEKAAAALAERFPRIDVLIHNAGALFEQRQCTRDGLDAGLQIMVAAPFLLTARLLPQLGYDPQRQANARDCPGRVITMSSGGMYAEPLRLDELQMSADSYSGVRQYARAKRAQVILNQMWAEHLPSDQVVCQAMHPGWVDTPGINEALPGFVRLLRPLGLLRTPAEGADTLIWLAGSDEALKASGSFWHDRIRRPIDFTRKTRQADTQNERQALWRWCQDVTGCNFIEGKPITSCNRSPDTTAT